MESQLLCWNPVCTRFCVHAPGLEPLFPLVLWSACIQALMAFKAKWLGALPHDARPHLHHGDTCLPRGLPGSGLHPSSGGLVPLLPARLEGPGCAGSVVAVVSGKAGCVWTGGGERGSGESQRQGKIFLWVPVSSPPQTHRHPGPESLGGRGRDQIFPLSP